MDIERMKEKEKVEIVAQRQVWLKSPEITTHAQWCVVFVAWLLLI